MATTRFLIVRVAGHEFALPASRVRAMTQALGLALTPLDGRDPLRYMVHINGTTVSVVVPNAALGLPERPISGRTCLLLIDQRQEAILVDSVSRFEEVGAECLRPPARIRLGQKWRTVLDPDQLRSTAAGGPLRNCPQTAPSAHCAAEGRSARRPAPQPRAASRN